MLGYKTLHFDSCICDLTISTHSTIRTSHILKGASYCFPLNFFLIHIISWLYSLPLSPALPKPRSSSSHTHTDCVLLFCILTHHEQYSLPNLVRCLTLRWIVANLSRDTPLKIIYFLSPNFLYWGVGPHTHLLIISWSDLSFHKTCESYHNPYVSTCPCSHLFPLGLTLFSAISSTMIPDVWEVVAWYRCSI